MRLGDHGADKDQIAGWAEEAHAIRRLMDNNLAATYCRDVDAIYHVALETRLDWPAR